MPADAPGPYIRLGELIARLREQQNISQRELCRRVSVSESYLSKIENGKNPPSVPLLRAIARELGVAYNALAVAAGFADPDPELAHNEAKIVVPADSIEDRRFLATLPRDAVAMVRALWNLTGRDSIAEGTPPFPPDDPTDHGTDG